MKLLTLILPMALMIFFPWHKADGADPKLTQILKAYDQREEQADPPVAHSAWLNTGTGKEEAAYLAENYDHLHKMRKHAVPTELARTGDIHVIPLHDSQLCGCGRSIRSVWSYHSRNLLWNTSWIHLRGPAKTQVITRRLAMI